MAAVDVDSSLESVKDKPLSIHAVFTLSLLHSFVEVRSPQHKHAT